ncbi:hypothetical protein PHAMO_400087 [Magnetospirillum molischianum DSM 120]|uniref:Uncharacterized protein n=1 Tax=Magnetospirillum molischianum DSM 120 TaxID=1150626 RepID=H8FWG8_MAGML|nr:hypothetical protein PHAMO_400087 [Magnetospirillum molischianum DSM 120]
MDGPAFRDRRRNRSGQAGHVPAIHSVVLDRDIQRQPGVTDDPVADVHAVVGGGGDRAQQPLHDGFRPASGVSHAPVPLGLGLAVSVQDHAAERADRPHAQRERHSQKGVDATSGDGDDQGVFGEPVQEGLLAAAAERQRVAIPIHGGEAVGMRVLPLGLEKGVVEVDKDDAPHVSLRSC